MIGTPDNIKGYIPQKTITFVASVTPLEFTHTYISYWIGKKNRKADSDFQIVFLANDESLS